MSRAASDRVTVAILVGLFAVRGVAIICVLPPGEMWDEYSHLAHVDHWAATGRPAVYGWTTVAPAFLAAVAALPQPTAAGFGRTYAAFWSGAPAPPLPSTLGLYEAQHPPLYYALAAPIYRALGGREHLIAVVAGLRLVNLALGTAAVGLIVGWVSRHMAGRRLVTIGAWVVLQPLLLLNVCRVANDGLAFLLGTAVVVTALGLADRRFWPRVAMLAVLLPAAISAKATNAALLPAVVVAVALTATTRAWPALPGRDRGPDDDRILGSLNGQARRAAMAITIVLLVTMIALAPAVRSNFRLYGLPTPMQEAIANRAAGRSTWAVLTVVPPWRWPVWTASWWAVNGLWVGGWSFLRPTTGTPLLYAGLLTIAAVYAIARRRSMPLTASAGWTMLCLIGFVQLGMMVHATESYAAWGGRVMTNPWYAAVAVPWLLVLLAVAAPPWLAVAVPVLSVVAEGVGVFGRMLPKYYGMSSPMAGLQRMAALHPAALGPATFAVAIVLSGALLAGVARQARRT